MPRKRLFPACHLPRSTVGWTPSRDQINDPVSAWSSYDLKSQVASTLKLMALLCVLTLPGCGSLLSEGASDLAGIAGAGAAATVTKNAAVAAAIGLGTQSLALEGVHYLERRVHRAEQDAIAGVAGPLE